MELPQPPSDQELRNIIDKLAQFVARNGPEFEHMTKTKQKNNPKFSFLYGGEHYHYYTYKVNAEQAILRQKGHPPPSVPSQSNMYNRPPPGMSPNWRASGPPSQQGPPGPGGPRPGFRGPPPNFSPRMAGPPPNIHHHDNWQQSGPPPSPQASKPRPLMDIPTSAGPQESDLNETINDSEKQIHTLKEQIHQSEQNLAAQKTVLDAQVKELTEATIRKSRWEHLELLSHDTAISLEDVDIMLQPIIESCTKETIGSGKVWIFQSATTHDRNRLLAHYLAYKVTDPGASFQLKLHLIYLMNDVVHHCVRKNNDDLKGSLESVAVEMFSSAWVGCHQDPDKEGKLNKLIKLWQDKSIFSTVTLGRMRDAATTWQSCLDQQKLDYEQPIQLATKGLIDTYTNYSDQHNTFVKHAQNTIQSLQVKKSEAETQLKNLQQPPPPVKKTSSRGSRWDTGSDGQAMPQHHYDFNLPPTTAPPAGGLVLPDLSRPPPGFGTPGAGGSSGGNAGPPSISKMPPHLQESSLVPTLPYHDLPAGLMVPLIKLEDSGYKPLNPKDLRLPPPSPPTDRLLAAIEQFYAPPSHDRPRDPEGWEMLGLYEWSRAKTAAIKKKADDIEANRRERSPTASPEPFQREFEETEPVIKQKRPRYRSRSRTRSRSRGSTPEDNNSRSRPSRRSASPEGGDYSMPSYLTKRSPSPVSHRRRSPTPPETSFKGFGGSGGASSGATKQLDSSNKGHQMMQKMGWRGSGLGTSEDGIVEPISGGEVRDKQDQFRGVGHGAHADPFEAFRKSKAGSFYTRMKERDKDRDHHGGRKSGGGGAGGSGAKN